MKTYQVEVLINVVQDASKIYDGESKFTGKYMLHAFALDGTLLHETSG